MVTSGRIVTPPPIWAPSLITGGVRRLLRILSFNNELFGAIKTPSPSTQPFEIVTWTCKLQFLPRSQKLQMMVPPKISVLLPTTM